MTHWTASNWRAEVRTQCARRAKLPSQKKNATTCVLLAIVCSLVAAVHGSDGSVAWTVAGIVGATIFGLSAARIYVICSRVRRETAIAHRWCDDAGPKVLKMVLDGGPKLGVDRPISDFGAGAAMNCLAPPIGGGHPILAVGAFLVSSLINGASYLKNKAERDRQQAALTADYANHSRTHLAAMLERYRATSDSESRDELMRLTDLALKTLPAADAAPNSVSLEKNVVSER
jgi:hypothetical protein